MGKVTLVKETQTVYTAITIEEVNATYFVVRATSERFGENEIVYEGISLEDAINYINRIEAEVKQALQVKFKAEEKAKQQREYEKRITESLAVAKYAMDRLHMIGTPETIGDETYCQTFLDLDNQIENARKYVKEYNLENETNYTFESSLEIVRLHDSKTAYMQVNITLFEDGEEVAFLESDRKAYNYNNLKPWQTINSTVKEATKIIKQKL